MCRSTTARAGQGHSAALGGFLAPRSADRIPTSTGWPRVDTCHFVLSGQPHLEEAYHFGEGVMPILRRAGRLDT